MNALWRDGDLAQRFIALTELLQQSRQFWRHHAFQYLQLPWECGFPELAQKLRALSYGDAEQLAQDDQTLTEFLRAYLPTLPDVASACALGGLDGEPLSQNSEPRDVPGRKWQQIRYFASCVPENKLSLLEWCSGKAHLGRILARHRGTDVIALERDVQLIAAGKTQAAREKVAVNFHCVDVMTAAAANLLQNDHNAIALHACGDLHAQLLQVCVQKRTRIITLAPCCYQLIGDASRYVLSQTARASSLQLRHDDLRTAVHGSVTSPPRERKKRQQLQAWRLGFDLMQRELRGVDTYLPTPALSTTILQASFADFCAKMTAHHQLKLPIDIDYPHYENAGRERLREVTALDLPRIVFRRALELWLVLDRALFLREAGYAVTVGTFCEYALTPRNIFIRAENPL